MPKKYYGWVLFGVFIIIAGILLIMNFSFFKKNRLEISAPLPFNGSNFNSAEENVSSEDETTVEIDMENSDADFEADADDFKNELEDMDEFDKDIEVDSINDEELL